MRAADGLRRARGAFVAALTLGCLVAAPGAAAVEPPAELADVCVDRRDTVYQVVAPQHCGRDERAVALPEDRPFHVCADRKFGWLRAVAAPWGCASDETPLTVPDSGPIYVCAGNLQGGRVLLRGRLRRVDDVAACDRRAETGFVTPAAPTAVDDGYATGEDALLDIPAKGVLANDFDLTGAPLGATLDTGTAAGTLALSPDGGFAYDPRGRFDRLDTGELAREAFRYVADDGALDSAPATATVTIVGRNDAPIAAADDYRTDEDSPLQIAAPGVLANDRDAEQHPLTAILVTGVAAGELSLSADGSVAFDPAGAFESLAAGESALVTFTYLARDGSADSTAAVATIRVEGRDDAPAAAADAYATDENTVLRVAAPGVLGNDTDAEGGPLRAELVSGAVALAPDGGFEFDPRLAFDALESGETAVATFRYRAIDPAGTASAPTQVTITVTGISRPAAVDDVRSTDEDSALAVDVLANDERNGGRITNVTAVTGTASAPDAAGVVTYDPRGTFDELQDGESGLGTFRYTLTNDEGSSTATVTIAVAGRNDPPLARDDSYQAPAGGALSVAAPGVLANDEDADDGALTAVLVAPPARGRLTLRADGSFDFDPAGDFGSGEGGTVSFAYRASDGRAESATAVVTIHVPGAQP